jgi:hypothetical protein
MAAVTVTADVRASLERLALRLEAASEHDPGNAQVAEVLLATLLALRGPPAELF